MKKRILIIDDDVDICTLLARFLTKEGYEVEVAYNGNTGIAKFKEKPFDVVLCDYRLGDKEGKEILYELKNIEPKVIFLIITGYADIKTAVEVIKQGAYDYIVKPLVPDEVLNILQTAFQQATNIATSVALKRTSVKSNKTIPAVYYYNEEYLVGKSEPTKELYRQVEIIAPTNYSVILYGESGTGKEVIAKTIHDHSARKNMPFVAMDCGTLSKELASSELFGHVKGAFTGALVDKEGHFELANGGTLFLDEVANLSLDVQASLLRVIQERKFKRVGGTKEIDLDVRVIVASNENLRDAYQKGKFREDLYHRFNEFSIKLPPLRERKEDIPLFAHFFLQKTNKELNKNIEGFDDEVMNIFINYSWPGNLREFRNVIRRAVLLSADNKITTKSLPWEITSSYCYTTQAVASSSPVSEQPMKEHDLKDAVVKAEYETIMKLLKEVNYNKSRAAEILKIDRKTLYNKIKTYKALYNEE